MTFTVVSGAPQLYGATLSAGFSDSVFFPSHSLPATFSSSANFTLRLTELPADHFTQLERPFYFPETAYPSFKPIFANLYHSDSYTPTTYSEFCLSTITDIVSGPPSTSFVLGALSPVASLLARILANSIIAKYGEVYYLDVNPTQTELSLPSVVSITKCRHFLLSAPERQLHQSDQRLFYSGFASESRRYPHALLKLFDSIPANSHIVVNSPTKFRGDTEITYQRDLISLFSPNVTLIAVSNDRRPPDISPTQRTVMIKPGGFVGPKARAEIRRELHVAGYFFERNLGMAERQPIPIEFRKVRFGVAVDAFFDVFEVMSLFVGAIVMLCVLEDQGKSVSKLVRVVKVNAAVEIRGFGFVKAVDLEREVVWVVAPVDVAEVNCVCLSTVLPVPAEFVTVSPRCLLTYADLADVAEAGA
jgi:hypothetical protein